MSPIARLRAVSDPRVAVRAETIAVLSLAVADRDDEALAHEAISYALAEGDATELVRAVATVVDAALAFDPPDLVRAAQSAAEGPYREAIQRAALQVQPVGWR